MDKRPYPTLPAIVLWELATLAVPFSNLRSMYMCTPHCSLARISRTHVLCLPVYEQVIRKRERPPLDGIKPKQLASLIYRYRSGYVLQVFWREC
jgi:hypothetical protein